MSTSPMLFVHIGAGILGILSGGGAMLFRKGSRRHREAGHVFVISMLVMSALGVYLALMKSEMHNVFGGLLTFYLVVTAWLTARRRDGRTGPLDFIAFLVALTLGATIVAYGLEAARSPAGKGGIPAGMFFFLGSIALLSAAGDLRMLVRGGLFGVQRIARHLWRMSFALFIASGSLFLARPQVFPDLLRRTHVLALLGFLPLILMIFWLVRVRFIKAYKRSAAPLITERRAAA